MNFPLFSFIMPAYKAEFIKESIDSILGQTVTNLELIVVDDYSPEPIENIVNKYTDKRLTYHRNEINIGGKDLIAQWNKCLSYATGEWIILATDDDVYEPTFLETFLKLHESYPKVDLFRGRICLINEKGDILDVERCHEEYVSSVQFYYEINAGMKGGIPQHIFRRNELVKKGGFVNFPKAWASDDATAILLSENGVLFSQKPLVRFRYSGQNISSKGKFSDEKVQARLLYSKWVLNYIPQNKDNDDFEKYYAKLIDNRLLTILKVNLLSMIKTVPYLQRFMLMPSWLKQMDIFGCKDKISIIVRSLF